jgi:transposase-like protein
MSVIPQSPIFRDEVKAREWLEARAWPNGPVCPHCGNDDGHHITKLSGRAHRAGLYQCNEPACRQQFTVTVGTVLGRSKIPLHKWLRAVMLLSLAPRVSVTNVRRFLNISYKSAWYMVKRLREVMFPAGYLHGAASRRLSPRTANILRTAPPDLQMAIASLGGQPPVPHPCQAIEANTMSKGSSPWTAKRTRPVDRPNTGSQTAHGEVSSSMRTERPPPNGSFDKEQAFIRARRTWRRFYKPGSLDEMTKLLNSGIGGPADDPLFEQAFEEWNRPFRKARVANLLVDTDEPVQEMVRFNAARRAYRRKYLS